MGKSRAIKHIWMVEDVKQSDGPGKTYWTKVGTAFANLDGSWSLELSAFPVSGKLQLRDPAKPEENLGLAKTAEEVLQEIVDLAKKKRHDVTATYAEVWEILRENNLL